MDQKNFPLPLGLSCAKTTFWIEKAETTIILRFNKIVQHRNSSIFINVYIFYGFPLFRALDLSNINLHVGFRKVWMKLFGRTMQWFSSLHSILIHSIVYTMRANRGGGNETPPAPFSKFTFLPLLPPPQTKSNCICHRRNGSVRRNGLK